MACRRSIFASHLLLACFCCSFFTCIVIPANTYAAVLPEDRVDVMYHAYDGGGATISGPSILVRKSIGNSVSVWGNYYIDMVTSATIDVLASGASEYEEERTEYSVGADYLHDKTLMSFSYTSSSENDYEAETYGFGISQDFFGDLTNISLGITFGHDTVRQNIDVAAGDEPFEDEADHRRFSLGISQILTKNLLLAMSFETVVDEGYLNNPYRQIRSVEGVGATSEVVQPEFYPRTHNSDAFAIRALYYLPYRASVRTEYRIFSDSWDIQANSAELRYVHPLEKLGLTLEGKFRVYDQTQADFYNDLFTFPNRESDITGEFIQFRARDKEMSEFNTTTIGFGVAYEMGPGIIPFADRSSVNLYWDHIQFEYANFRNRLETVNTGIGIEPLYSFNANVVRVFFSMWY